jgi:hypothetical protein
MKNTHAILAISGALGLGIVAGGYIDHRAKKSEVEFFQDDAKKSAEFAKITAENAKKSSISAIKSHFNANVRVCLDLGQIVPLLTDQIETKSCETGEQVKIIIEQGKEACQEALNSLNRNNDIPEITEDREKIADTIRNKHDEIKRYEMDPRFPGSCKKPKEKSMSL